MKYFFYKLVTNVETLIRYERFENANLDEEWREVEN